MPEAGVLGVQLQPLEARLPQEPGRRRPPHRRQARLRRVLRHPRRHQRGVYTHVGVFAIIQFDWIIDLFFETDQHKELIG